MHGAGRASPAGYAGLTERVRGQGPGSHDPATTVPACSAPSQGPMGRAWQLPSELWGLQVWLGCRSFLGGQPPRWLADITGRAEVCRELFLCCHSSLPSLQLSACDLQACQTQALVHVTAACRLYRGQRRVLVVGLACVHAVSSPGPLPSPDLRQVLGASEKRMSLLCEVGNAHICESWGPQPTQDLSE